MNPFKMIRAMLTSAPRFAPLECAERIRAGSAVLIDVREPREWDSGVAKDAVLLSFSDLIGAQKHWSPFLAGATGRELLLYCGAGVRSGMAARLLTSKGFRAANTGSFSDWAASGWPIVKLAHRSAR